MCILYASNGIAYRYTIDILSLYTTMTKCGFVSFFFFFFFFVFYYYYFFPSHLLRSHLIQALVKCRNGCLAKSEVVVMVIETPMNLTRVAGTGVLPAFGLGRQVRFRHVSAKEGTQHGGLQVLKVMRAAFHIVEATKVHASTIVTTRGIPSRGR